TSAPAALAVFSACLMTPRSAPSVRLKWVYHWYFSRLVRIACCGLGISPFPSASDAPDTTVQGYPRGRTTATTLVQSIVLTPTPPLPASSMDVVDRNSPAWSVRVFNPSPAPE